MNASERKEFISELKQELLPALKQELVPALKQELLPALKKELVPELKRELLPDLVHEIRNVFQPEFQAIHSRLDHHEELLETIAMAVNAHATVLDAFEPKVKDHDERLERLERTVARIRLSHGLR